MMHYDVTVNDDCEIRLSGDQTFDEAQANQQTFAHAETICQEMHTQVPARRKCGPKPGTGGPPRAYSTHHLSTQTKRCDRELAKARNRDRGVETPVGWPPRPDHARCPDRNRHRHLKDGPWMRRETAPAPDARSAMGLSRSKVGWVNDRFITD
jgi:hypothetical protein